MKKYNTMSKAELDKTLKSVLKATRATGKRDSSRQPRVSDDYHTVVHELEVHQIELEIQNRELRETRDELEDSRDRYANLYDFAPLGYATLDGNGCIHEINLTGAMRLGAERSRLIRKPFVAYVAKSDAGRFMDHLRRCVHANEQSSVELGLTVKGGGSIQVQLLSVPAQDDDRGRTLYRTAITDITALKLAEYELKKAHDELQLRVEERTAELSKANTFLKELIAERERSQVVLRQSEERFRATFEKTSAGMVIAGQDGRLLQTNPAFCKFLGYSEDELRRLTVQDITHPDDLDDTCRQVDEITAGTRQVLDLEKRYARKDGTKVWGHTTSVFLADSDSKSSYSVAVVQDITERKRLEEQIKQRNIELAAAVSNSLELSEVLACLRGLLVEHMEIPAGAIFLYDEPTHLFQMHSAWNLPGEMLAKAELFPAAGFHDEDAIPKPDGLLSLEFHDLGPAPADLKVGTHQWTSYLRVPLVAKGQIQGVAALLLNGSQSSEDMISFFKTLGQHVGVAIQNARLFEEVCAGRARLQKLSQRLVELQETERRDIARELHDQIGQQLTGLKLTLETCLRLPPERARDSLAKAQSLANEVTARVHDLSLDLRPTILDDLGLLPALLWQFNRYTESSNIQVTLEQAGLEERFDPGVETAAYRIVQEALTNVARHAGVTEATVRVWSNDDMLCVVIEDHGVGFDSRAALDSHSSSGLTGMRERALLLGGHLYIEATSGVGCRLTVELPLNQGTSARGEALGLGEA